MKLTPIALAVSCLLCTGPAFAGGDSAYYSDGSSGKSAYDQTKDSAATKGSYKGAQKDQAADSTIHEMSPIVTRNARNETRTAFSLAYRRFHNERMEEADNFDGGTWFAEIVQPFGHGWELIVQAPFYTSGTAWEISPRRELNISGTGGIFDFSNALIQKELTTTEHSDVNVSVYAGYGYRTNPLESDEIKDKYNHRGQQVRAGVNVDNAGQSDVRLSGTADFRYFYDTDDLNPSPGGDITFPYLTLSGAAVYTGGRSNIKPGVEVIFITDFDERLIAKIMPEAILRVSDNVELAAGWALGHSDQDGTVNDGVIRGTFRF